MPTFSLKPFPSMVFYNILSLFFHCLSGNLQVLLLSAEFKGEAVNVEVSFMSIKAISYLGSIGLLGEYCPSSRKKNRPLSDRSGCMHLVPFQEHQEDFYGCSWLQHFENSEDLSSFAIESLEDNTAAICTLAPTICFS